MIGKGSSSVWIVDGLRSPFLKAGVKRRSFSAAELAIQVVRPLLLKQNFEPRHIDEMIVGCAIPSEDEANIARVISLRSGIPQQVPAWTVHRNCGSGMQSLDSARHSILSGRSHIVVAGGVEAMSRAPLIFQPEMTNWLSQLAASKSLLAKLKHMTRLRPAMLKPIISLLAGLKDPVVGMSMGQTAEQLAYAFGITRVAMDTFALTSHQRARAAESHRAAEISPVVSTDGGYFAADEGVRPDSTLEKLAQLQPFFDKPYGKVTAGNSSQVTDGACFLVLASDDAVRRYQLNVRGRLQDCQWMGCDPALMGLGPVYASSKLLQRHKLSLSDIDCWEINEAFAAQVLACLAAMDDVNFCQKQLGLEKALGKIPSDRLNREGGAVSLGHPIGASGARIVLQCLQILEREKWNTGIASLCIGGGQGGAMLIERAEGRRG